MADSDRVIHATLSRFVRDKLERAYLADNTLLMKLTEQGRVEYNCGGLDTRWKIKTERNPNWESFAPFEKVNFVATHDGVTAEIDYAAYRSNDFMPRKEQLQNRGDKEVIYDLERQKVEDLVKDAKIDLNIGFHRGDGTSETLVGLETAVPDTNFTNKSYAGIAFTGNSYWQNAQVNGAGGTNSSFAVDAVDRIETALLTATRDNETGAPDWGLTNKTTFAKITKLHTSNQRYDYEIARKIGGGIKSIIVSGCEIFWDAEAEASVLRLLQSKKMQVLFMTGQIFEVKREATISPSGVAFYLECFPALKIEQPRYFAAIHNA